MSNWVYSYFQLQSDELPIPNHWQRTSLGSNFYAEPLSFGIFSLSGLNSQKIVYNDGICPFLSLLYKNSEKKIGFRFEEREKKRRLVLLLYVLASEYCTVSYKTSIQRYSREYWHVKKVQDQNRASLGVTALISL